MTLPHDYLERTYAGVLGKMIGVYLGRPFEQWSHERIDAELGEITGYVHERLGMPLIVTDDDLSGTFTFIRALSDNGCPRDLTPAQVGHAWLNYIVENRSILWWGGIGNSTEHTSYLRLKAGHHAPASGSARLNTKTVAEQIGAQIFIDSWAMVAPNDPSLAASLAARAASVSHDGEAIYAAQVIAVMESLAYTERDIPTLLDRALAFIPTDCLIRRVIDDVRNWHAADGDWRITREKIAARYGYQRYGGNCHIVPNHALIHLGLLYGGDDFGRAMMIVNTAGWDTDCNAGNLGCLLGIRGGLATFDGAVDWRAPIADRLYVPSAAGDSAITDAVTEACRLVRIGAALAGEPYTPPKVGAHFHFDLPGAVQGFAWTHTADATLTLENVAGHSAGGQRSLALRWRDLLPGQTLRAATPTFIPPDYDFSFGYGLDASPRLYPGQTLRTRLSADAANSGDVLCRLHVEVYGAGDQLAVQTSPAQRLSPGGAVLLEWRLADMGGAPIARVGVTFEAVDASTSGTAYLDFLTWSGEPDMEFQRPAGDGKMWKRAWVRATDPADPYGDEAFRVVHNRGRGLWLTGGREWANYNVSAEITVQLAQEAGIGGRVQGLMRYYAFVLCAGGIVRLIKALDGERVLAEEAFDWQPETAYALAMTFDGAHITCALDGRAVFSVVDDERPLLEGGIALVCAEGRMATERVRVSGGAKAFHER
jgi:ADP-ribosylglycohydrolase